MTQYVGDIQNVKRWRRPSWGGTAGKLEENLRQHKIAADSVKNPWGFIHREGNHRAGRLLPLIGALAYPS
jgi:hypothetical protein